MVVQKAVKSYPLVKWFLIASGIVVVVGLFASKVITDPNHADTMLLIGFIVVAAILPFLAMAFPRREVVQMSLPTDHLASMSKEELEGMLSTLDTAKAKGEMDDERYAKARARVLEASKAKGKASRPK